MGAHSPETPSRQILTVTPLRPSVPDRQDNSQPAPKSTPARHEQEGAALKSYNSNNSLQTFLRENL